MAQSSKLYAVLGNYDSASGMVQTDVGTLLRRLLLFDTLIVQSVRLSEFPSLVRILGLQGTLALLKSGALKFQPFPVTVAEIGRFDDAGQRTSYAFTTITTAIDEKGRQNHVSNCFHAYIDNIPSSPKDNQKLRKAIAQAIAYPPLELFDDTIHQLNADLRADRGVVRTALARELRRIHRIETNPDALKVILNDIGGGQFQAVHDLQQLGLDEQQADHVLQRALLTIGGANQRIAEMRAYDCLSGFDEADLPLVLAKAASLFRGLDPMLREHEFMRVMEILNLPDFSHFGPQSQIDIPKFLEIRQSDECVLFRHWLADIGRATPAEILDQVSSLRSRIELAYGSLPGKTLRFLAPTAVGAIPVYGPAAAVALGAIDTFFADKLMRPRGIVSFLGDMYPSLFIDNR